MDIKKIPKIPKLYECINCNIKTYNKKDYSKHLLSTKHLKTEKGYEKIQKNPLFSCECGKTYKYYSGLWRHTQKCIILSENKTQKNTDNNYIYPSIELCEDVKETIIDKDNIIEILINENKEFKHENKEIKNLILEMMKNNNDLQKQVLEICKNTNNNNTIINSNNGNITNNKTFNLQVFLNEECKDAMNMSEFINSIQVNLSDLENIGNQGYIEGVSNIIINHLNNTEMYKRPVHCSDAKRETLYVKEENKWEKEGPDNKKMKKAVLGLEKKNFLMLNKWKEKYPKCMDSESTQSDAYMKLISKVMNGDEDNINKVIKRVAKEVVISK